MSDQFEQAITAIEQGNLYRLQRLLGEPTLLRRQNDEGQTLLHFAAEQAKPSATWMLIRAGANAESPDKAGRRPLFIATVNGRFAVVRFLVQRGARVNQKDNRGRTALHACANWLSTSRLDLEPVEARATIADYLLRHGAWVNASDRDNVTPLMLAAKLNHISIAEVLLERGANVAAQDVARRTALTYARGELWGTLHAKGVPVGVTEAIIGRRFHTAYQMVSKGQDIRVPGPYRESPLLLAARAARADLVTALLKRNADPNAPDQYGVTPLIAVITGDIDRSFLSGGVRYSPARTPELRLQIVKLLLAAEAQKDHLDHDGANALAYAQRTGQTQIAEALMQN